MNTGISGLIFDDAKLMRRIEAIERAARELGPSIAASFAPVVANLQATVIATIQATYSTTAQMNAAIASPGAISPTTVTASGAISAGDVATFNPGIVSSDVHARVLSVGYDSVYIDVNNRLGISPSARRFKQDIQPVTIDTSAIDRMQPQQFRLIGAVEALGDKAKIEVGFIAEDLDEIGYGDFVTRDNDGVIAGIAYERLTVPLVAAVKELRATVKDLQTRLTKAGL